MWKDSSTNLAIINTKTYLSPMVTVIIVKKNTNIILKSEYLPTWDVTSHCGLVKTTEKLKTKWK